ncbi:MAG: sulfite exporter TauE/SafE family protein [Verrucomicrobiales bacterium]|nr:sulfite exporter TauE/SafE family protein [Verrucomicrobiales bacterium]
MSSLNPETLTLGGLFVAGLATSLHCAGMCGLLTCGLGIAGRGPALASVGIYHACRLIGYAIAGAAFGFIGNQLGFNISLSGVPWIPVLLIAFLIAIFFGLDKKLGAVPGLGKVVMQIKIKTLKFPVNSRAAIIGLATPLLPCGPLYAILALALASGSAIRGMEIMLAFGFGALPAIWAVQIGSAWVNRKLGARGFLIAKRTLAATAAISLMWHFSFIGAAPGDEMIDGPTCRCTLDSE